MKKLIWLIGLYILLCLISVGCQKEKVVNNALSPIEIDPPISNVTASVYGKVMNEYDEPMAETNVQLNDLTVTTDQNGFFNFRDVNLNAFGNPISVNQDGYFNAVRLIQTNEGAAAYIELKLIARSLTQTINSNTLSHVNVTESNGIVFQADSFVDEAGDLYNGEVNVYAHWLDPTDLNTLQVMPGDLRAVNQQSEIVQLATYGMMAVELETPTGESLNLAEGKTAELTIGVQEELLVHAPLLLPMWYFDDASGYWVEDGEAKLQDGKYVGMVSHFTFWNIDAPFPVVNINGLITDTRGNGLVNIAVELGMQSNASVRYGWTDANGYFFGLIPANEVLSIRIYDSCDDIIYESSIGPFAIDLTIEPIEITNSSRNVLFTGDAKDCNGNPITNGYIKIETGEISQEIFVKDDGSFSGMVNVCDATQVRVIAVDIINNYQSETMVVVINGSDVDLGEIVTCLELLFEYFFHEVNGIYRSMNDLSFTLDLTNQNGYIMSGARNEILSVINVVVDNGPGDYMPNSLNFSFNSEGIGGVFCLDEGCNTIVITFHEFPQAVGEVVRATFAGTILVNGVEKELEGAFRTILQ